MESINGVSEMELDELIKHLKVGTKINCKLSNYIEYEKWFKCVIINKPKYFEDPHQFWVNWTEEPFYMGWCIEIDDRNKNLVQLLESDWDE